MKWLENKCRESEAWAWGVFIVGIGLVILIVML